MSVHLYGLARVEGQMKFPGLFSVDPGVMATDHGAHRLDSPNLGMTSGYDF